MRLHEVISPRRNLSESNNETVVFTFGRFNPPTIGHEKLVQKVLEIAANANADHVIFLSQTQKKGKDPLPWNDKVSLFKKMFPEANASTNKEVKNPYSALLTLGETYDNIIMIAGSDRASQYDNDMRKYLDEYKIKNFKVVSAGIRDPDAEGVEGMSASKARALAVDGHFEAFSQALPSTINNATKKAVYNTIRQNS